MMTQGSGTYRLLSTAVLFTCLPVFAAASQPAETGFIDRTFQDDSGQHKYVVFVPHDYTPDRSWPVILFLHGAGERGTDGSAQVKVGLGRAIQERQDTFPFITVFPQCEDRGVPARGGWLPQSRDGKRALAILGEVERTYRTDKDRVYLTGLSMGGFGTWAHAAADPDRWAAAVPICGGGNPEDASKLVGLPIWCFHGGDDRVVPAEESRRMIAALEQQSSNRPRYTEFEGVGHNSWDAAYKMDELYSWLLSQKRSARAPRGNGVPGPAAEMPQSQRPAAETDDPFVPALEIPDAVFIRLGNEMLAALADAIPTLIPPDAMSGSLPDVQQTSVSEGMTVNVRFSGIRYQGRVSRVLMEAQGEDRVNVTVTLRDVHLVFDRTYVWGEFFSATCGPLRIVLGHRADLPLSFQVRPVLEQEKLRLQLIGTQFNLPPGNWTVGSPAWVSVSGVFSFFIPESRIVSGLRDGIRRDSSRIEREVAGSVPRMLARLENRFTLEPTEGIVVGLWPLPVYKPRLRTWPTSVRTDATGITVALGVSVAAFDAQNAPAQPKRVLLDGQGGARELTGEQFQFGVALGLMEPLSTQVVADDAARAHVSDMPMEKLQPLGDAAQLAEIVPDLKQRGDREIRAELRLVEPLRLTRGEGDLIVFELPKVRCAVAVHPEPASSEWIPYMEIDFSLKHGAKPSVTAPTGTSRSLALNWQDRETIEVQARFAPGYSPRDEKIDTARIRDILSEAWHEWTSTGALAQVALDDLDLGSSKLRADKVAWRGPFLTTSFGPAGVRTRNRTNQAIAYEVKGPHSEWGGPYTLEPENDHYFAVPHPLTCRFTAGTVQKIYTLPPGANFEFQLDTNGLPELFISHGGSATGAVSMRMPVSEPAILPIELITQLVRIASGGPLAGPSVAP